jgi:uncharacterized membrane protein
LARGGFGAKLKRMQARWEPLDEPAPPDGPVLMDAVLTPNRSLSRQAFLLVIGSFVFMNAAVALFFVAQGAFPVAGFLGLDVLALFWAFRMNYRSGRAVEQVLVSRGSVQITRSVPDKPAKCWSVSPLWVRVHDDPRAVRLAAGGRSVLVGGFLSPKERTSFAEALKAALARARG